MNEHGSNEHEQYLTYMKKTKTVALICEAQTNIARGYQERRSLKNLLLDTRFSAWGNL